MSKYGEVAVAAALMVSRGQVTNPPDAWCAAVEQIFPGRLASQRKSCPRGAFLGLCESGLVKGVPSGSYTRSRLNKKYALDALEALRENPALANSPDKLWCLIIGQNAKVENAQMDVVISLWQKGLIA